MIYSHNYKVKKYKTNDILTNTNNANKNVIILIIIIITIILIQIVLFYKLWTICILF